MAKTLVVADRYRTNELSLIPGGSTVTAVYKNGKKRAYKKVKKPEAYAERIKKDLDVTQILVDGNIYWTR